MYRFIDKIRTKDERYRQRFVLASSLVLTAVIGLVWGLTLPATLGGESSAQLNVASATASSAQSPLSTLYDSLKNSANFALEQTGLLEMGNDTVEEVELISDENQVEAEVLPVKAKSWFETGLSASASNARKDVKTDGNFPFLSDTRFPFLR